MNETALTNSNDAPLESTRYNSIHQNDLDLVQLIDPALITNDIRIRQDISCDKNENLPLLINVPTNRRLPDSSTDPPLIETALPDSVSGINNGCEPHFNKSLLVDLTVSSSKPDQTKDKEACSVEQSYEEDFPAIGPCTAAQIIELMDGSEDVKPPVFVYNPNYYTHSDDDLSDPPVMYERFGTPYDYVVEIDSEDDYREFFNRPPSPFPWGYENPELSRQRLIKRVKESLDKELKIYGRSNRWYKQWEFYESLIHPEKRVLNRQDTLNKNVDDIAMSPDERRRQELIDQSKAFDKQFPLVNAMPGQQQKIPHSNGFRVRKKHTNLYKSKCKWI